MATQKDQNMLFKADYPVMQVKSIEDSSLGAFYITFDLHYATICF